MVKCDVLTEFLNNLDERRLQMANNVLWHSITIHGHFCTLFNAINIFSWSTVVK
jgi:hypothetical protein